MSKNPMTNVNGLPELIVICRAAHLMRNFAMRAEALRRLRTEFGIKLSFVRSPKNLGVTSC
ncbi:hypothetical protein [Schlesneria sp. T3-172]|uniref:hypothetical protein n=1 Tax=Schlesneria sphaerica TaxID=3373610 RepID=UPI0037C746DD